MDRQLLEERRDSAPPTRLNFANRLYNHFMPVLNVIANPHNRLVIANLLAAYWAYASPADKEDFDGPAFTTEFSLDGLRTHPDLDSAMRTAAQDLDYTDGLILGYHVLVNPVGVIFAVAMSMSFLTVRLGSVPGNERHVESPGAGPNLNFGEDWMPVNPWNLQSAADLLARAFAYVNRLENGGSTCNN